MYMMDIFTNELVPAFEEENNYPPTQIVIGADGRMKVLRSPKSKRYMQRLAERYPNGISCYEASKNVDWSVKK